MLEVTDLPAVPPGKERGHDLVVTVKVTAAVVAVEVVSAERRVELPESTVPSSVVDEVVLVAAVAASAAAPLVLLQSRFFY